MQPTLNDEIKTPKIEFIHNEILKIVKEFHEFCQMNKLEYSLCGGSVLGAHRHKGFIPWDDDFDVYMTKKDAEKLIQLWDSKITI